MMSGAFKPSRLQIISVLFALFSALQAGLSPAGSADVCALLGLNATSLSLPKQETYCRAIAAGCLIELVYEGDPPGQPRLMRPHALGTSSKGNLLLVGQQLKGFSKSARNGSGRIPGLRHFSVAKIGKASFQADSKDALAAKVYDLPAITSFLCKGPLMVSEIRSSMSFASLGGT